MTFFAPKESGSGGAEAPNGGSVSRASTERFLAPDALDGKGRISGSTWDFSGTDLDLFGIPQGGSVTLGSNLALNPLRPFDIFITQHGGYLPETGRSVRMLIAPTEFKVSASQVSAQHFTREGALTAMEGVAQTTISLSGSSSAFVLAETGLAPVSSTGMSRTNSLSYANFISLLGIFKSGGYQRLSKDEDVSVSQLTGRTRVINVLDVICLHYDGTYYYGHFNSLSVEVAGPHRFTYSMEFTVSGIMGDRVEGHIGDGKNQESGIIFSKQGSNLISAVDISEAALQPTKDQQVQLDQAKANQSIVLPSSGNTGNTVKLKWLHGVGETSITLPSLSHVTQADVDLFNKLVDAIKAKGFLDVEVIDYLRTVGTQMDIKSRGKSTASASLHLVGAAIDVTFGSLDHKVWYTRQGGNVRSGYASLATKQQWVETGIPALASGMSWGGNFSDTQDDYPHFHFEKFRQDAKNVLAASGRA